MGPPAAYIVNLHSGACMPLLLPDSCCTVSADGLPEFNAVTFGVGEPAELAEVVAVALGIDVDAGGDQAVEQGIEIVHLEIEHGFLRGREVVAVLLEEGKDDARLRGRRGKPVRSVGLHHAEMLFVPLIQSFWIVRSQKDAAKPSD